MKITMNSSVVESHGIAHEQTFMIKASGTAFQILSSGLYADKIGAVLRELGCNAADAHIANASSTKPFEVKLPTALDPGFYVKDWGPGLSKEEVIELYTTYFSSSKSDSNDFTGAFGLGSKSPFSYTDQFTLTSVHGGTARHYIAYLGDEGFPRISEVGEEPAQPDWPHGLRVSFPVNQQDVGEFTKAAKRIFRWFRQAPRIRGMELTPEPPLLAGERFRLYRAHRSAAYEDAALSPGLYVLMGNVCYPVDVEQALMQKSSGDGAQADLIERFKALHTAALVLTVDIGTVSVAASREQLQYTEATRAALYAACVEAAQEMFLPAAQAMTEKTFSAVTEAWEAVKVVPQGFALIKLLPPDQAAFVESLQNRELMLPRWLQAESTDSGRPQVAACWVYDKAGRRRVLAGEISRGSAKSRASIAFKGSAIVVADSMGCDAAIRLAIAKEQFVSVVSIADENLEVANKLAQSLSNECCWVPIVKSSTLERPPHVLRPKRSKSAPEQAEVLQEKLRVVSLRKQSYQEAVAASVEFSAQDLPETVQFYLDVRKDRKLQVFASRDWAAVRDGLSHLAKVVPDMPTEAILLSTSTPARVRDALKALGVVSLTEWLHTNVATPEMVQAVKANGLSWRDLASGHYTPAGCMQPSVYQAVVLKLSELSDLLPIEMHDTLEEVRASLCDKPFEWDYRSHSLSTWLVNFFERAFGSDKTMTAGLCAPLRGHRDRLSKVLRNLVTWLNDEYPLLKRLCFSDGIGDTLSWISAEDLGLLRHALGTRVRK